MMRSVGLVTEYNPFHNGHRYHLRRSRQLADAEVAVAVMSGHFLQRGEPALVDKWVRTRMALAGGVDVVIELPFPWACNSAPQFAAGAIAALEALGGVDALCFGSESGELEPLLRCARLLEEEAGRIASATAELLKAGMTYPAAREQVVRGLGDGSAADLLTTPNNILGLEYLRALGRSGSRIEPLTVRRLGPGFHTREAIGDLASATGIRRMLAEGREVGAYLPEPCARLLAAAVSDQATADDRLLYRLLAAAILRDGERLTELYQVDHGLDNRLGEAARTSSSYEELVAAVKARQLTRTRVQRILIYTLLGIHRDQLQSALAAGPRYLHLLGCSERGRRFLAATRTRRSLPLVQNFSRIHAQLKRHHGAGSPAHGDALAQLRFEERATACYQLLLPRRGVAALDADYRTGLVAAP